MKMSKAICCACAAIICATIVSCGQQNINTVPPQPAVPTSQPAESPKAKTPVKQAVKKTAQPKAVEQTNAAAPSTVNVVVQVNTPAEKAKQETVPAIQTGIEVKPAPLKPLRGKSSNVITEPDGVEAKRSMGGSKVYQH